MSADQLERLANGIRAAHEAGNADHVKKLGAEYKRLKAELDQGTPIQQQPPEAANSGLGTALKYGADQAGILTGKGVQSVGELIGSETVENFGRDFAARNEQEAQERNYQRPEQYDGILKNLKEGDIRDAIGSLGYMSAEGAPQVATGVAASLGAGAAATFGSLPAAVVAGGATGLGVVQSLGESRQEAEEKGLDSSASMQDVGTALASGLVELVPMGKGAGFSLKFLKEGLQEATQEGLVIGNTTLKGGEYVPEEVAERLFDAGVVGGTLSKGADLTIKGAAAPVKAAANIRTDTKNALGEDFDEYDAEAVRRIEEVANTKDTLKTVNHTNEIGSAQGAVKGALTSLRKESNEIKKNLKALAKAQGKPLNVELIEKAAGAGANHKATVSENYLTDVLEAFDHHPDAERWVHNMRVLTRISQFAGSADDLGGLSKMTRHIDPMDGRNDGMGRVISIAGAAVGGHVGGIAMGAGGIALNRAARVFDTITNRRSTVKRYADSVKKAKVAPKNIQGPRAFETVERIKEAKEAAKAEEKRLKDEAKNAERLAKRSKAEKDQAAKAEEKRLKDEAKNAERLAKRSKAEKDQAAKAEAEAQIKQLQLENRKVLFETNAIPNKDDASYHGDVVWGLATGLGPAEILQALSQLESEGKAPKGTAENYARDPSVFKKDKSAFALQEAVRSRFNKDYPRPNKEAFKLNKEDSKETIPPQKPTGNNKKDVAAEGQRRSRNATTAIERAKDGLTAPEYFRLLSLLKQIDSPSMTAEMREARAVEVLSDLFKNSPEQADKWFKELAPVITYGNDHVIEIEREAKEEQEWEEKTEKIKTKAKPKDKPKAKAKEKPKKTDNEEVVDPTEVEDEPKPTSEEIREESEPDVPKLVEAGEKKKGNRKSLTEQIASRIDALIYAETLAEVEGPALLAYLDSLGKSAEDRIERIVLTATGPINQNMITERYSSEYGVPMFDAHIIVNSEMTRMEEAGKLKRFVRRGQGLLKKDGEVVKDSETGETLFSLESKWNDPEMVHNIEVSKAMHKVSRTPDAKGPDMMYDPNNLSHKGFRAFKDIPNERIDGTFMPLINVINKLRTSPFAYDMKIIKQIRHSLDTSKTHKAHLREVLEPETPTGRNRAPLETFSYIEKHIDTEGSPLAYQEWSAGANGRLYSSNNLAHSQAGDIMKALIKAPERSSIGEGGVEWIKHSIGNLLGKDKESVADRKQAAVDVADILYKFSEKPLNRYTKVSSRDNVKPIANVLKDGEGFFQVLNAANEVKAMVDWARERHPSLSKESPSSILSSPDVIADLDANYETDFIVQLDASNNAYQLLGLVTGDSEVMQATGILPPNDAQGDPSTRKGADIYMKPALTVVERVPDLKRLMDEGFPQSKLRKVFKKPISTFLYANEFSSRKESIENELFDAANGANIFGIDGDGLIEIPEDVISNLKGEGHVFVTDRYDTNGEVKKTESVKQRIVETEEGWKIETTKGKKPELGDKEYDSANEAIRHVYGQVFYKRVDRELVRDLNTRYPQIQNFMRFADVVAKVMKDNRGEDHVKVPTKDGISLQYTFKTVEGHSAVETEFGDGKVTRLGLPNGEVKLKGRGLAAFMIHQLDAYVLRETYARGGDWKVFNPIHDSFGFHPSEAQKGQELALSVMQELGSAEFNLFDMILRENGITPAEFIEAGGDISIIHGRQNVDPVEHSQIPTAIS